MTHRHAQWASSAPRKRHWFAWLHWRGIHLSAGLAITLSAIALTFASMVHSQHALHTATSSVDLVASQYTKLLATPAQLGSSAALDRHLQRLVSDEPFIEASVYDAFGNLLALASSQTKTESNVPMFVSVTDITDDTGTRIAVLKLNVNTDRLLAVQRAQLRTSAWLQTGILITALCAGILLTLGILRYRYLWAARARPIVFARLFDRKKLRQR